MLGSVLVGLDGSEWSKSALELGLRWAKQADAHICGMTILDRDTIVHGEFVPIGASAFKDHRDQRKLEEADAKIAEMTSEFEARCQKEGVKYETRADVGSPWRQLAEAAQEYDLVLLGTETHFHFSTQDGACETVKEVIKHAPRPVVAVPEKFPETDVTIIAFDGSLQAARALQVYVACGLRHIHGVHIVSVADKKEDAEVCAQRAARFLSHHDTEAEIHAVESHAKPSEVLLEKCDELEAGIMVMGAYGNSMLREFFFGSATVRLLSKAHVPVFVYH